MGRDATTRLVGKKEGVWKYMQTPRGVRALRTFGGGLTKVVPAERLEKTGKRLSKKEEMKAQIQRR